MNESNSPVVPQLPIQEHVANSMEAQDDGNSSDDENDERQEEKRRQTSQPLTHQTDITGDAQRQQEIFDLYHDSPLAGHLGYKKH